MDEQPEIVQHAILLTQYEQKAKADLVQLQYELGRVQAEGRTIAEKLTKESSEMARMQVELQHLSIANDDARKRLDSANLALPLTSLRAGKAKEDADAVLESLAKKRALIEHETTEVTSVRERKLRLRDSIAERIKQRVQPLLDQLQQIKDNKAAIAAECWSINNRQKLIVEAKQEVAKFQEEVASKTEALTAKMDRNTKLGLPCNINAVAVTVPSLSELPELSVETKDALLSDESKCKDLQMYVEDFKTLLSEVPTLCELWRHSMSSLRSESAQRTETDAIALGTCIMCVHASLLGGNPAAMDSMDGQDASAAENAENLAMMAGGKSNNDETGMDEEFQYPHASPFSGSEGDDFDSHGHPPSLSLSESKTAGGAPIVASVDEASTEQQQLQQGKQLPMEIYSIRPVGGACQKEHKFASELPIFAVFDGNNNASTATTVGASVDDDTAESENPAEVEAEEDRAKRDIGQDGHDADATKSTMPVVDVSMARVAAQIKNREKRPFDSILGTVGPSTGAMASTANATAAAAAGTSRITGGGSSLLATQKRARTGLALTHE